MASPSPDPKCNENPVDRTSYFVQLNGGQDFVAYYVVGIKTKISIVFKQMQLFLPYVSKYLQSVFLLLQTFSFARFVDHKVTFELKYLMF